jgi:type III secretion protein C
LALNNLEAVFSTRQSFYVPVQGNQDASLTSVTASTFLRVTPMFTNEGETDNAKRIKMLLNVQDSSVDNAQSSQVSGLPTVTENQIATQAIVNNGDTLVIGGQVVRKVLDADSGLPFLNRLPVIGLLFGSRARQYQEFLRIYVISPRLLGEDSLQAASASVSQPNGTVTNSRMLQQELPRIMQGTSLPSNPDVKLAPGQKEQDGPNSIVTAVPTI